MFRSLCLYCGLGLLSSPLAIAQGESNDPSVAHDSGIYLYSAGVMTILEPAAYQGHKMMAIPYWPGATMKAIIQGPQSSIRTGDTNPVFYFYFDTKAAGLGQAQSGTASSPNQYALIKMESKKSDRETPILKANYYWVGSVSQGSHNMVSFRLERLRAGVYKVFPAQPLEHGGEYCFMRSYAGMGAAAAAEIYDFGVN